MKSNFFEEEKKTVVDKVVVPVKELNYYEKIPNKPRRRKKGDRDYVDNKRFTKEVGEWAKSTRGKEREEWDEVPPFVIECIMLLIENYSKRFNWRGYTYLDEMKSEATLTCMKYLSNFDIDNYDNAYGYYSKFIENAFKLVWKREKVQADLRNNEVSEANTKVDYENVILWYDDHDPNYVEPTEET